jgi:DNA-binding transcriptional ArsR family regulator
MTIQTGGDGETDPTIDKALEHALRRRILCWQARRATPASPKMMSAALEHPLPNLAYHVRVLRDAKLLRETQRVPSGGSLEHFFLVDPRALAFRVVAELLE